MRWRMFALLVGALVALMAAGPALAHPERPVRFIVGFGAGGNVAFEAAVEAEPDGHTVMLASPAFAVAPALYGNHLRWKQKELAPVILNRRPGEAGVGPLPSVPHPPEEHTMAAPPSARRDRINPHFPKLVEMTHSYVYGDLWERKQLSKRDRSVVTIAALVALGWKEQLESHIARGLGNGLSREEIAEIITHLSMYAGWPAAMTASHVAVDVFEADDKRKG